MSTTIFFLIQFAILAYALVGGVFLAFAHPCTEQVTEEEIIKLYYDYALGAGNGAVPKGRTVSSFVFEPSWQSRPMPPRDKYAGTVTDSELGLVA